MRSDAAAAKNAETPHTGRPTLPPAPDGFPHAVALFLDLDGTVLDLMPTPEAVWIPRETIEAIGAVADKLDGALAILSGRSLEDIDRILAPLRLPAAALHGAELRRRGGGRVADGGSPPPQRLVAALGAFVDARPGLSLEDKGASVAIHYRSTPQRESEVRERVAGLVAQFAPTHELQPGKMVVEVRPRGCHKGGALDLLMDEPPFAGRRPIVLGDDLTDEFAFEAALARGGDAILIGEITRSSVATYALPNPEGVRAWIEALAAS